MLFSLPKQSAPSRYRDNDALLRKACNDRLAAVGGYRVTCTGNVPLRENQSDFKKLVTVEPSRGVVPGIAQVPDSMPELSPMPEYRKDEGFIGPLDLRPIMVKRFRNGVRYGRRLATGKAQGCDELQRKKGKALPAGTWLAESVEPVRQRVGLAGMQYSLI